MIFVYNRHIFCISNNGFIYEFLMSNNQIEKKREIQISEDFLFSYSIIESKLFVGGEKKIVFVFDLDLFQTIDALPALGMVTGITVGSQTNDIAISTDKSYMTIYTFNQAKKSSE